MPISYKNFLLTLVGLGSCALQAAVTPADWKMIREEYQKHRHAAYAVSGGYQARNPSQQWMTQFDGQGFEVTPSGSGWTWGLQLRSYAFGDRRTAVTGKARVRTDQQRVEYQWNSNLTEWYVNSGQGLEHGFTIQSRPAGAGSGLRLDLAVRGPLRPVGGGTQLSFTGPDGGSVVRYSGLKAWDAKGRTLPAQLRASSDGVQLEVDDRGADYPLTIDPVAQQAYLRASNPDVGDRFGASVAIWGDTVVVGAPGEDSAATGVNGSQANNAAVDSGAAYVFVRNGGAWTQQAYLKASNAEASDNFGNAVAVWGNTIVVGAVGEDSAATTVNGSQTDNSASVAGAAYVFVRSGTTWSQQAYLKASNAGAGDYFGFSVGISGDTIVVGAHQEDSAATGVNGDQASNDAFGAGAAYVFVRNGSSWSQQAYLKASNAGAQDEFGSSVAISGDTIAVGAPLESGSATGINGPNNNSQFFSGAVYVFVRSAGAWSQQAYVKASNTDSGDSFGFSVALSGDTMIVGAIGEGSNASGVNGNQSNNSLGGAGAAYVFVRSSGVWSQQAYLKASNPGANDRFGQSVAVSGDLALVGSYQEDSGSTGVNGNQNDESVSNSGAAYLFARSAGAWTQQDYLKGSSTSVEDLFGEAVALESGTAVVGSRLEDGPGDTMENSGAVHIFSSPAPAGLRFVPVTPCRLADTRTGEGLTGNFGPPMLPADGTRELPVPFGRCNIPITARAYAVNVTAIPTEPLGFLTLWPTGEQRPNASTLNSFHGGLVANSAIVPAGTNGSINVYVTHASDVIVDINGYFETSDGYAFYPLSPCRLADTRAGGGFTGAFGPPTPADNETRTFPLASGGCQAPATAKAHSLNFTVVPKTVLGFLSAWPAGGSQPFVSTLNSFDGAIVSNAALTPAGTGGGVSTYVTNATDIIIDTNGYFGETGGTGALSFHPVTPCRVADTRITGSGSPSIAANETRAFSLAGVCNVPSSARAYSVNVTVVPHGGLAYLTLWPTGSSQPNVSTLNSFLGRVVANAAIVPAGEGGRVNVFATNPTDVILDVNGYFQ